MSLGAKITQLRKEHQLSQEAFAEQFNVTRQTVSNWENEKSSPDLETLVKISEKFQLSVDELLKNGAPEEALVEAERTPKKKWWRLVLFLIPVVLFVGYLIFNQGTKLNYQLQAEETLTLQKKESQTDIATGHFNLSKDGTVTLKSAGSSDSGNLTVRIIHNGTKETVYQKTADDFSEEQRLSLAKGAYDIQITASDVQEQVLSVTYDVSVNGS